MTTSVLKDWGGDWGRYFGESPGTTLSVPGDYLAKGVEVGDLAGRYSASTSSDN